MKDVCLVVPTIRESCMRDFIQRWAAIGLFDHVDLIVMEDNLKKTFSLTSDKEKSVPSYVLAHYCWEDIEAELGKDSWIIPRRSDTVRSFAYLRAYKLGYKYMISLDDDCYPPTADKDGLEYDGKAFVDEHLKALTKRTRWFNTLNSTIPRGIPYYNRGKDDSVIVNHGLWTNVLDYDAPHQLVDPAKEKFSFDNRIVPAGMYFPMCGMNICVKAEAIVLMYHLLMGQQATRLVDALRESQNEYDVSLTKLPMDRFGDIHAGILMKKIADMTGHHVSSGMPYIRHERASNPFANLKKEANGIEVNEVFWEYVDKFSSPTLSIDFTELYSQMGDYIAKWDRFPEYIDYYRKLGKAMNIWASHFFKP